MGKLVIIIFIIINLQLLIYFVGVDQVYGSMATL